MLPQLPMIDRLRQICQADDRLVAAMLYGSFTREDADRFSDIDCMLYFDDSALPEIDQAAWVGQIAPVEMYYHNEYGIGVAIFANLVRAEFHFDPASEMAQLETLRGSVSFPSLEATLLLDRNGELAQHLRPLVGPPASHDTPEDAAFLVNSFMNWSLFGTHVRRRGELARALEILHLVHDYLLRMVRLLEGAGQHWITPTKALEAEISPAAYRRYQSCTAPLDGQALEQAYRSTWEWGSELMASLGMRYKFTFPEKLLTKIGGNLTGTDDDR